VTRLPRLRRGLRTYPRRRGVRGYLRRRGDLWELPLLRRDSQHQNLWDLPLLRRDHQSRSIPSVGTRATRTATSTLHELRAHWSDSSRLSFKVSETRKASCLTSPPMRPRASGSRTLPTAAEGFQALKYALDVDRCETPGINMSRHRQVKQITFRPSSAATLRKLIARLATGSSSSSSRPLTVRIHAAQEPCGSTQS